MGTIEAGIRSTGMPSGADRRLRVLVIDEEFPYPPNAGKRIRSWNLLRRLARRHQVSVLCYGPMPTEIQAVAHAAGIEVHACQERIVRSGISLYADLLRNLASPLPYSVAKHTTARFREQLRSLVTNVDLVHCEWGPYANYIDGINVPATVSAHNVEAQIWQRRAASATDRIARWYFSLQARRMERFERTVLRKAAAVAAVSEQDCAQLRAWGLPNVLVVDNGVDVDTFLPAPEAPSTGKILFLASLDWFPNQDALWFFVREVLPHIQARRPETVLQVAGRRLPEGQAAELRQTAGVEFVGEVPDVRALYTQGDVVIVPLRIGGGSRLKILEAMAAGKAIVSTTIGAEGLRVNDGRHLRIADDPPAFAQVTLELLADVAQRHRLGAEGRKLVEQQYSWDHLVDAMDKMWRDAAAVAAS